MVKRVNWRVSAALSPVRAEVRATLGVAAPLIVANLAQMAMGFTNTVMVGRLGSGALAAAGLGGLLYFTSGFVLQGVISAAAPLAAHALGAGDRAAAGRVGRLGLVFAVVLSLPLAAAAINLRSMLLALGYETALADQIGRFLGAVVWGAPAFLGFAALRNLLAALSHTRAVMTVLMCCVPANAALNWVLIYGHLGAPPLGVAGAGIASAIVQWLMFGGLALYISAMRSVRTLLAFGRTRALDWHDVKDLLRLGAPIGGILALEVGVFVAAGVLVGLISADALGANQIVFNVASLTFMVPMGVSQAATVRCAFELGAQRPDGAWRAARVALALGVSFMAAAAIVLWSAPRAIVAVYLDVDAAANHDVVAIATRLMFIAALFQVFDGTQTVAAGALRGYKDAAIPMVIAGIGYWGIGFVGGALLAFPLGYGAIGLWWGLALGLAVVAMLLGMRLFRLGRSTTPSVLPRLAAGANVNDKG
ncbi:MAG TPA: MATE family efflux transporter [Xanthobacteraceae bacterium]|nr:MATE family efflux transporter [Xanthobacteraceae bacterium]